MAETTNETGETSMEALKRLLQSRPKPNADPAAKPEDGADGDKNWQPKCFPGCGCQGE